MKRLWDVFCKLCLIALFFFNMFLFALVLFGWMPDIRMIGASAFWSAAVVSVYLLESDKKKEVKNG